jgi:hypothetical protein
MRLADEMTLISEAAEHPQGCVRASSLDFAIRQEQVRNYSVVPAAQEVIGGEHVAGSVGVDPDIVKRTLGARLS